jgi:hypothetical protein
MLTLEPPGKAPALSKAADLGSSNPSVINWVKKYEFWSHLLGNPSGG